MRAPASMDKGAAAPVICLYGCLSPHIFVGTQRLRALKAATYDESAYFFVPCVSFPPFSGGK